MLGAVLSLNWSGLSAHICALDFLATGSAQTSAKPCMQTTVQCTDSGHVPTQPVRRSLCCGTGLYCRTRTRSTSPRQLPPCTATIACMHACMQIPINLLISLTFQQEKNRVQSAPPFCASFQNVRLFDCCVLRACCTAEPPSGTQ